MDIKEQIKITEELLEEVVDQQKTYGEGWEVLIDKAETLIDSLKKGELLPKHVVIECDHSAMQPVGITDKMKCLLCGHTWSFR